MAFCGIVDTVTGWLLKGHWDTIHEKLEEFLNPLFFVMENIFSDRKK